MLEIQIGTYTYVDEMTLLRPLWSTRFLSYFSWFPYKYMIHIKFLCWDLNLYIQLEFDIEIANLFMSLKPNALIALQIDQYFFILAKIEKYLIRVTLRRSPPTPHMEHFTSTIYNMLFTLMFKTVVKCNVTQTQSHIVPLLPLVITRGGCNIGASGYSCISKKICT